MISPPFFAYSQISASSAAAARIRVRAWRQETGLPVERLRDGRDFRRRAASLCDRFQFALTVRSESETGADVFFRQVRKIRQYLVVSHSAGKIFKDIIDSDAESANTGLAAALARLDRDEASIVHSFHFMRKTRHRQRESAPQASAVASNENTAGIPGLVAAPAA